MGYFNYFVKCVIRNFINLFFKHKIMFSILVAIFVLYLFCGSARAESVNLQNTLHDIDDIYMALIEQLNELEQIKNSTDDLENYASLIDEKLLIVNSHLVEIKNYVSDIRTYSEWTVSNLESVNTKLVDITTRINTLTTSLLNIEQYSSWQLQVLESINDKLYSLNNEILNIYNKLEQNQKELLTELEKDNQAVLEELNMIRDAINGSDLEPTNYTDLGIITSNSPNLWSQTFRCIRLEYQKRIYLFN